MTMKHIAKTFMHSTFLAILLVACTATKNTVDTAKTDETNALSQQNVDATIWFNTSAENYYMFEQTYAYATELLRKKLMGYKGENIPAIVIDLDETVLDNSPYMLDLIKKGETFTEESWAKWVDKASANAMPGAIEFLRFCEASGVMVYYVSNRSEKHLEQTIANLTNLQLPNADPHFVLLMQDSSDKSARRHAVETEHSVLLYLGDNLRDFDERFRDRTNAYGKVNVRASLNEMLPNFVLFPNPMYGQWQRAFTYKPDATPAEKAAAKVQQSNPVDY